MLTILLLGQDNKIPKTDVPKSPRPDAPQSLQPDAAKSPKAGVAKGKGKPARKHRGKASAKRMVAEIDAQETGLAKRRFAVSVQTGFSMGLSWMIIRQVFASCTS